MIYLMLLINLIIIFYEWSKTSLATLFWAVVFLIFSIPHVLHSHGGEYSAQTINQVTEFAVVFMCVYFAVRFIYFSSAKKCACTIDVDALLKEDGRFINYIFLIFVICFLIVVHNFYRTGGTLMTAKAYVNYDSTAIERLAMILMVSLSGIGSVLLMRKEYIRFSVCIGIYIFYFLITQIRYNLIGLFMPFMIYFLFNDSRRRRTLGITLGIFFVLFAYFTQQIRGMRGVSNVIAAGFGVIMERTVDYLKAGDGEFGLIKAFYYFVENDNNFPGFGEGLGFIRLAMIALPASLFQIKPRDFAIDMYREWFHDDNPAGTMHPTVYGDAYANFGFWGCLTGTFYGLLMVFADEHINSCGSESIKVLKISLISTMMIMLARGAVYNSIFNCVLGLMLLFILERVFLWKIMISGSTIRISRRSQTDRSRG